jgi:hypothetical protein
LYEPHFKKVVFYSDYPVQASVDDVAYIDIQRGYFTHKVFKHFYENNKELIDDCDGLFYTMDDNIINLNILNLYRNDKILFFCEPFNASNTFNYPPLDIEDQHTWHWEYPYGKHTIRQMLMDDDFKKYNITKFSGAMSDWFYLPKKYLTSTLFEKFDKFSRVVFEIAIPSIIHNLSYNKEDYQPFTDSFLMGSSREQVANTDYVYVTYNHKFDLVIHPIKYNQYPIYNTFLPNLFAKEKCIVIYTNDQPTENIYKYSSDNEYDVIVVGDIHTPNTYKNVRCIFLDVNSQHKLFPAVSENVKDKKILGLLFAAKRGYKTICDGAHTNIVTDIWTAIGDEKIIELYKC